MAQVIDRGRARCAGFGEFVWIWNAMMGLGLPGHHRDMAAWLEACWQAGKGQLLLMAFRNSGKSTLVGLFCAWLLYRDADLRILVLAADLGLAKKMVRNVKRVIERHPLLAGLLPEKRVDWGTQRFTVERPGVLRDPSMQAAGIGGNITGSRADVVICDDVEVPKNSDSAHKRAELREKLGEIAYVLSPDGTQIYVGTPHSYYSIYADEIRAETGETAPFLAGFERFCLPILDEQGQSNWPDRFPITKIEEIRTHTGERKFASQMMLKMLAPSDGILDPARLHRYGDDAVIAQANGVLRLSIAGRRMVAGACHFDPSFGASGGVPGGAYGSANEGDGAVIACVYVCERGEYWLHDMAWLTFDATRLHEADEASQICAKAAAFIRQNHLPSVRVETNGVGRFLPNILRRALKQADWAASVVEHHEAKNKDARIEDAFGAVLSAGLLHAHARIWQTPFIREMREWRPGEGRGRGKGKAGQHDDGLDAVAGCLIHEPVRLPRVEKALSGGDWRPAGAAFSAQNGFQP
ncbi:MULTISPECIES: phage terminase large subunit [Thalassospira]|uniref:phage terminase large subunit n=1 Tax=Thalassospira TaxID=168934 RepID=UPI0008DD1790|nr:MULTISPECIES: phage terminase large subunit [Thalassospira]MAB33820.1 hypothetical protein [Thalassospira sp.]MDM7977083.1 phage terminase large subunit [Thalassospira xiamenensis]OHZ01452.1 hypothetical protein BC440_20695 [Thalassospira sp. MIT1004]